MLNEMSPHQAKIHRVLAAKRNQWLTNQDIGQLLPDVAARTIRQHTKQLVEMRVLEESRLFGGYRYRYQKAPDQRAVEQLNHAAEVFGL
jgi:hypothetical protein